VSEKTLPRLCSPLSRLFSASSRATTWHNQTFRLLQCLPQRGPGFRFCEHHSKAPGTIHATDLLCMIHTFNKISRRTTAVLLHILSCQYTYRPSLMCTLPVATYQKHVHLKIPRTWWPLYPKRCRQLRRRSEHTKIRHDAQPGKDEMRRWKKRVNLPLHGK